MKRKCFNFSLLASLGLMVFGMCGVSACSNSGVSHVTSATVRMSVEALSLNVGETKTLNVSVSPKNYASSEVFWVSTNENVALVKDGVVFGVGAGSCQIHCYIGGGRAICDVTVTGGGAPIDTPTLILSPRVKSIKVNEEFTLKSTVYPSQTVVTYSSSNPAIASVTAIDGTVNATIKGLAVGTAVITALGDNGKTDTCTVTITENGGGGGGDVEEDLGYTGNFTVGAPLKQQDFMKSLLSDFNKKTNSKINFTVITWEEDQAADNMSTPKDGPDVYPYASDQTLRLFARNALWSIPNSDASWISSSMGADARTYATLAGVNKVVGYPFAADNGYVMFYDKSVCSAEDIDTVDKLFAKADELNYEVNFDLAGGFYSTGTLMTYNGGKSLYKLTAKDGGAYSASSTFDSEAGLKAGKLMKKIFNQNSLMGSAEAPGKSREVLATITDTSKVAAFKQALGDNYAAAPLPFVDDNRDVRLAVYLGYKFYGINPQKGDANHLAISNAIAKFLANSYAQEKRFEQFSTQPTLSSLQDIAKNEPHIAALIAQKASNGCVPLTAVDIALWDQCAVAAKAIKDHSGELTDEEYHNILADLDTALFKK